MDRPFSLKRSKTLSPNAAALRCKDTKLKQKISKTFPHFCISFYTLLGHRTLFIFIGETHLFITVRLLTFYVYVLDILYVYVSLSCISFRFVQY